MSNDWDFYGLSVDDQPASIFLDLGIFNHAPLTNYPILGYLRLYMRNPREDGLSSQEEFNELVAIEDKFTNAVVIDGTSLYVGRNTSGGCRDFYFYTHNSAKFESDATEAMLNFADYQYEIGTREEKDWITYFEFLYPSKRSMQFIMNKRVREQLESNGDKTSNIRQIDHFILLPTLKSSSMFLNAVKNLGFNIPNLPIKPGDGGVISIEISRLDSPSQIDDIVIQLFDLANELGGEYDGWGCEISP